MARPRSELVDADTPHAIRWISRTLHEPRGIGEYFTDEPAAQAALDRLFSDSVGRLQPLPAAVRDYASDWLTADGWRAMRNAIRQRRHAERRKMHVVRVTEKTHNMLKMLSKIDGIDMEMELAQLIARRYRRRYR